jgi:hypothetical protein
MELTMVSWLFHPRAELRLYLAGDLPDDHALALRAHLRSCATCRAEYDRAAELLRRIAGKETTRREEAELGRLVRVALRPAPSEREPREEGLERARRPLLPGLALRPALPAALAAVVLVATVGLISRGPIPPTGAGPEVQARGGAPAREAPLVDLELYAASLSSDTPVSPRRVEDGGHVRLDEVVQFSYRNGSPRIRHLYLLGIDARLDPIDYFPRPSSDRSIAIEETLRMKSISPSIRLAKRHEQGPLFVVAFFSERELSREAVHRAVRQIALGGIGEGIPDRIEARQAGATIDLGPEVQVVSKWIYVVNGR